MSASGPARWWINGRYLTQPQTGVQRYAGEITRAIDACLATDATLARRMDWRLLLPADCKTMPRLDAIKVERSTRGRGYAWEQTILPATARGGLVNLANLGALAHPRQIVCMHDANVFLEPSSYSKAFRLAYRGLFPALARRARAVTTVSHFSADMLAKFGVTRRSAQVVSNGHEHALTWDASRSHFSAPDAFARPFVFALGSRAKHKRLDLLIELAPALDALGIDLVLSGGTAGIFAEAGLAHAGNVRHVGFVSDDDLAALFGRALCFAFPSRTEGFGLPLLEAMVHGAPIVSADGASMPEVCGDAALYAAQDVPSAWLAQIQRYRDDAGLRETMILRGRERYQKFSWHEGARRYIDLALSLSPQSAAIHGFSEDRALRRTA